LDTYRQDGNDDPHCTENSIVDCFTDFQGVLDALIIAVKPSAVRLNGARLNDEEGQCRWNHACMGGKGKRKTSMQGSQRGTTYSEDHPK
jgi:hypothetical protein